MKPSDAKMLLDHAVRLYIGTAEGDIVPIMAVPVDTIKALVQHPTQKIGRPRVTVDHIPNVFMVLYPRLLAKEINISEAARECNLSRPTIYKYLHLLQKGDDK